MQHEVITTIKMYFRNNSDEIVYQDSDVSENLPTKTSDAKTSDAECNFTTVDAHCTIISVTVQYNLPFINIFFVFFCICFFISVNALWPKTTPRNNLGFSFILELLR